MASTPLERADAAPRFISFEGVDGAGKTTNARRLGEWLRASGADVVDVREPGGTDLGERLRAILLGTDVPLHARAEALLFAAARAQLLAEVIEPALGRGAIVIADRFVDSSLVYQGVVRGLGVDEVMAVNRFATAGRVPDLTVLLRLGDDAAASRRGDGSGDRFEGNATLLSAVARAYEAIAAEQERTVIVDADAAPDEVARRVREAVGV